MRFSDALDDLAAIRWQLARSTVFRGYRSQTIASTAALGLAASAAQSFLINDPIGQYLQFVLLWTAVAAACVALTLASLAGHLKRQQTDVSRELARQALAAMAPCLLVGAFLTLVALFIEPEIRWMTVGLWSMVFSLGVFASVANLPRAVALAGAYYLIAGAWILTRSSAEQALDAWQMAVTFGVGQALTSVILYLTLETQHDAEE